jgi:hypothetical protein
VAAVVGLFFHSVALAAPRSADVELVWSALPGCPREAAVRAEIERLVGHALSAGADAPLHATAWVTYDQRGWRAKIAISGDGDGPREREIEGETCAQVADAAAVIVALAIDPAVGSSLAARPKEPSPPPSPPAPPLPRPPLLLPPPAEPLVPPDRAVPQPVRRSASPPSPDRAASRGFGLGIKMAGGVDLLSFSAPAIGFGVGGFVSLSRNRIELFATGWLPEVASMPRRPYAGAEVSLLVGGARYCRTLIEGVIGLAGCGGIELGSMTATSYGVTARGSGSSFWLAPGLGIVGLLNPSHRFTLSFELAGLTPSVRRSFWITGLGEVYRPPALTVRAVVGAEVTFR